jgi:hypothetical protein
MSNYVDFVYQQFCTIWCTFVEHTDREQADMASATARACILGSSRGFHTRQMATCQALGFGSCCFLTNVAMAAFMDSECIKYHTGFHAARVTFSQFSFGVAEAALQNERKKHACANCTVSGHSLAEIESA